MAIEIEAKMRLDQPAEMRERLLALDAQPTGRFQELNTFFDTPEGRLKTSDQGLRVRVETHDNGDLVTYITHKGPRAHGQLKNRTECEAVIENAQRAAALISALGYHPVISFEKRRQRYALDGCQIELDTLPHLGEFIEIEGPTEAAVLDTRAKLGLADEPIIKASYIAMLQDHLRQQGHREQVIRFPDEDLVTAPA